MNIIFESVTDHPQDTSDTRPKSSPLVTDFFEARHQLMLRRQDSATSDPNCLRAECLQRRPYKTARAVEIINRRPRPFRGAPAVAEQALYWLISAPALAYLVYLILGL
jgi:hypothetical protein